MYELLCLAVCVCQKCFKSSGRALMIVCRFLALNVETVIIFVKERDGRHRFFFFFLRLMLKVVY